MKQQLTEKNLFEEVEAFQGIGMLKRFELTWPFRKLKEKSPLTRNELDTLEAMIRSIPEETWHSGRPVFFKSVSKFAAEEGITARTLNRRFQKFEALGIGVRTTKGPRYAVYGEDGEILLALGFDLSPLYFRQEELQEKVKARLEGLKQAEFLKASIKAINKRIKGYMCQLEGDSSNIAQRLLQSFASMPRRVCNLTLDCLRDVSQKSEQLLEAMINYTSEALKSEGQDIHNLQNDHNNMSDVSDINVRRLDNTNITSMYCNKRHNSKHNTLKKIISTREHSEKINPPFIKSKTSKPLKKGNIFMLINGVAPLDWKTRLTEINQFYEYAMHRRINLGISDHAWHQAITSLNSIELTSMILFTIDCRYRLGQVTSPGGLFRRMAELSLNGQLNLERSLYGFESKKIPNLID